jgi:hypothetical protein
VRFAVTLALLVIGSTGLTGCEPHLPEGKPWTVDTSAWAGSAQCTTAPCTLDAYRTRTFSTEALVPGALADAATVVVRCYVPTPSPQRDPIGRDAARWYLLSVDDALVWAPDLALSAEDDLGADPPADADPATVLAAGVALCDSQVPGR